MSKKEVSNTSIEQVHKQLDKIEGDKWIRFEDKLIFYIIDRINHKFYFFEDKNDAEFQLQKTLLKLLNGPALKPDIIPEIEYQTLKNYHGVVWVQYRWDDDGSLRYNLQSRYSDIRKHLEYNIRAFTLTHFKKILKKYVEEKE